MFKHHTKRLHISNNSLSMINWCIMKQQMRSRKGQHCDCFIRLFEWLNRLAIKCIEAEKLKGNDNQSNLDGSITAHLKIEEIMVSRVFHGG